MASAVLSNLRTGVSVRVDNFLVYRAHALTNSRPREISFRAVGDNLFFLRHWGDFVCVRDDVFTLRLNADTELDSVEV